MYKKILLASSIAVVIFSGCSSKQYYNPQQTYNASSSAMGDKIVHYSRDGATLASGDILTRTQRVHLKLEKGFYFINNTKNAALTADANGKCNIVTQKGTVDTVKFPQALVAGTLIGKFLVYVLQNNSFGVYDLEKKSIVYSNKAQKAFVIDTRIANPLQIDSLVIIPTLDGKLTILDLKTLKVSKEMYVSTETSLNNIIFLGRLNNTLIASTPYKVLSISNKGKKELDTAISEVVIQDKELVVFAKDGRILKLDESLSIQSEKKFKFAHFSVATVYDNTIYALDKQGYLIVSNSSFSQYRVYKVEEVEGYAFISQGKLYYNQQVIDLKTLTYK
jgi:hypothetical protein